MSADSIAEIEKKITAHNEAPVADNQASEPETPELEETEVDSATTENTEHEDNEDSEPAEGKPKKKPGVHNRINELVKQREQEARDRKKAQEEAEYWRNEALKTKSGGNQPEKKAETSDGEPSLEEFDYDQDKYFRALAKWEAKQMLAERDAERMNQEKENAKRQREQAFMDRVSAFSEQHPEFVDEVLRGPLAISEAMADYIRDSDVGPEIGWHFRNHPAEAQAIFAMSPREADRALARLEARLESGITPPTPTKPAPITSAPAVASRVSAAVPGKKNPAQMSVEDHIEAIRKGK